HELRVSDAISGWWPAVKLLDSSKQHQRNNHPDRDFGKRIVQSQSPAIAITCQICLHIPEQAPYIVHSTRFKDRQVINYLPFKPRATRKVSADLSREALGLRSTTLTKFCMKDSTIWENPLPWKALTISTPS